MGLPYRLIAALAGETRAKVRGWVRVPVIAVLAATLAGCATLPPSPLPPPQSPLPINQNKAAGDIMTRGILIREGNCVVMNGMYGRIVPIWPSGTTISDEGVRAPGAGGGTLLRFGEVAYLHGVHIPDLAGSRDRSLPGASAAGACGKQAFVVNRAETQRAIQAAAPNLPYSGGILVRRENCLVFEPPDGVLLPIWPEGTVVTEDTVVTPDLRGRAPLIVGRQAGVEGRYVYADDGSLQRAAGAEAAKCAQRGMLVEKARRVYIAANAAENAEMSDAVLVLELVEINPSEPLQDGFLTTMVARVVEPLTGHVRAGEMIKLRYAGGRDPVRGWQASPHDLLFEVMGQPKVKPGDRLLLFVLQDFYRQQAEARDGRPLPGYIGVGGGLYRIENGRIINEGMMRMPETLDDLRRELSPVSSAVAQAALGSWHLTHVNGEPVRSGVTYTFRPGGIVEGEIACNFYNGRYRMSSRRVIFGGGRMTERGCMGWPAWLENLEKVVTSSVAS